MRSPLRPFDEVKSNIFELWIKSESLGQFTNQEEWNDSDGFFKTTDLVEIKNNGDYRALGRSGSLIKTTQGVWTQLSDIEEVIKKIFSLSFFHSEKQDGHLNLLVSSNNLIIELLQYFEKNYGLDCKISNFQSCYLEKYCSVVKKNQLLKQFVSGTKKNNIIQFTIYRNERI